MNDSLQSQRSYHGMNLTRKNFIKKELLQLLRLPRHHPSRYWKFIEAARESATIGKRFNLRSTFRWPVI